MGASQLAMRPFAPPQSHHQQSESKLFSSNPITFQFSSGTQAIEKYFHSGAAVCPAR
ncbi:Hypothetical protein PSEBR_m1631 [Pseudomonas brassicacearum subsp. brassicacearum NFM421]|uniref:Uncharacterized protein n=1 Tax=Pseudomonas brassicacearum (strain NFM421) TaxID=994484 RepID=F2KMC7_PSEBN|nr:Hypothetical protein PSEBR_m1631 [Pseudomonas brassicacearum subsp. brassicacearum NFM421]